MLRTACNGNSQQTLLKPTKLQLFLSFSVPVTDFLAVAVVMETSLSIDQQMAKQQKRDIVALLTSIPITSPPVLGFLFLQYRPFIQLVDISTVQC